VKLDGLVRHMDRLAFNYRLTRLQSILQRIVRRISSYPQRLIEFARQRYYLSVLRPAERSVRVCYLTKRSFSPPASPKEVTLGGAVKLLHLNEAFPHSVRDANILYVVSSVFPKQTLMIAKEMKRKGVRLVVNQNGLYYQGWYGEGWEDQNEQFSRLHSMADFVVYQSAFCKMACEKFLINLCERSAIVHNCVDTEMFVPCDERRPSISEQPVLFAIAARGKTFYRVKCAIEVLAQLKETVANSKLLIAGYSQKSPADRMIINEVLDFAARFKLDLNDLIFYPPYTREQAPSLLAHAHILLHTKYNDPCPNLVIEALSCGLPVVYSASGGTPELVDSTSGVGVETTLEWEKTPPLFPEKMAQAVVTIVNDWEKYSTNFSNAGVVKAKHQHSPANKHCKAK
jgi:glycosyltransferase involved in cell wall biosynthesis